MKNCDDVEACLQKRRNKKMMNRKWDDIYREGGTTFRFQDFKDSVTRFKTIWHESLKIKKIRELLDLPIQ